MVSKMRWLLGGGGVWALNFSQISQRASRSIATLSSLCIIYQYRRSGLPDNGSSCSITRTNILNKPKTQRIISEQRGRRFSCCQVSYIHECIKITWLGNSYAWFPKCRVHPPPNTQVSNMCKLSNKGATVHDKLFPVEHKRLNIRVSVCIFRWLCWRCCRCPVMVSTPHVMVPYQNVNTCCEQTDCFVVDTGQWNFLYSNALRKGELVYICSVVIRMLCVILATEHRAS